MKARLQPWTSGNARANRFSLGLALALALIAAALTGCSDESHIRSDAAPAPQPPHQRWREGTAAPEQLLTPSMGIFRRISWRGDRTWMQGEYRSGDAVVQVTAIPYAHDDERYAALQAWQAEQAAQQRQVIPVTGTSPAAAWSLAANGRDPMVCWIHGSYLIRASLLTPHDAETLRLFMAHWR